MTFSNQSQLNRVQNVVLLPYDISRTSVLGTNPDGGNSGAQDERRNWKVLRRNNGVSQDESLSSRNNIHSNNEYIYYMKTSMLGRIMNNAVCGMCPKY